MEYVPIKQLQSNIQKQFLDSEQSEEDLIIL